MRDNTEDWVIPRGSVPTLNQLEARIDEALVVARVSEEGVREVGEMALDAARQARRAAEAAEKSAEVAADAVVQAAPQAPAPQDQGIGPAGPVPGRDVEAEALAEPVRQPRFEARFRSFNERADRVAARLRALQEQRSHGAGASVAAVRLRGDG